MKTVISIFLLFISMSFSIQTKHSNFNFPDLTENGINVMVFENEEVIDARTSLSLSAEVAAETDLKVVLHSELPNAFHFSNIKGWEVRVINEKTIELVVVNAQEVDLELQFLKGESFDIDVFENGKEVSKVKRLYLKY